MLISVLHPWRIRSVLSMWVFIALTTMAIAPVFPALILFSSKKTNKMRVWEKGILFFVYQWS